MTKPAAAFTLETDLCKAFLDVLPGGWTPYPETAGWDLLLSRDEDGFQIGIEAKLRLNAKVIAQALDQSPWRATGPGPDCRAVLVPGASRSDGCSRICDYIGITVISWRDGVRPPFWPPLPKPDERWTSGRDDWFEQCPIERVRLPEYVPDVAAGASAPIRLTDWKVKAIKIAVLLRRRPVTRNDFKALQIDIRRWLPNEGGWLQPTADGFVAGPRLPDFAAMHPAVWSEIEAGIGDWAPGDLIGGTRGVPAC